METIISPHKCFKQCEVSDLKKEFRNNVIVWDAKELVNGYITSNKNQASICMKIFKGRSKEQSGSVRYKVDVVLEGWRTKISDCSTVKVEDRKII